MNKLIPAVFAALAATVSLQVAAQPGDEGAASRGNPVQKASPATRSKGQSPASVRTASAGSAQSRWQEAVLAVGPENLEGGR